MTLSNSLTLAFVIFSSYFIHSNAQATHTVSVGVEGSFYDPATISAEDNDVIQFIFGGDVHDVTQGNFDLPCFPLDGGFHSGFLGRGPTLSGPPSVWNLIVTNSSEPIWFFCATLAPTSHCAAGMVGAINPPSIDMYNSFLAAAKLVTSQPALGDTPILTGVGATATGIPVTTILPGVVTITAPPSMMAPTSTPTTTSSSSSGSSSLSTHTRDDIIGGVIGGVALLIILLVSFWFCYRRSRNSDLSTVSSPFIISQNHDVDHRTAPSGEFLSYRGNSPPVTFDSPGERGMRQMGAMNGAAGSATALNNKEVGITVSAPSTISTGRTIITRPSQPQFSTGRESPVNGTSFMDLNRSPPSTIATVLSPVRANSDGVITGIVDQPYTSPGMQMMSGTYEPQPQAQLGSVQQHQLQQSQMQYNRSDIISIYPQAVLSHIEGPHTHTPPQNMAATQNQLNLVQPQLTGSDHGPHTLTPQSSFLGHSASTRSFPGHSARVSPPPRLPPIPSGIVAPSPMTHGGGVDIGQLTRMGTIGQLAQMGLAHPSGLSSASNSSTNLGIGNNIVNQNNGGVGNLNVQANISGPGQMQPPQGQDQSSPEKGRGGVQRTTSIGKSVMSTESGSGSIFSLMQSGTPAPPYQQNE